MTTRSDERGGSAVEYGLLVAGIAAVVALAVFTFGGLVSDTLFGVSCDTLSGKMSQSADGQECE